MTELRLPANEDDALHTVQRMIERAISWPEVVAVVARPDTTRSGHSNRINYYRVVGQRRIRVTVDAEGSVWTVAITGGPT